MDNQENGNWENANDIEESDDEQEQHFDEIMADPEPGEDLGLGDDAVNEEENWNLFNMNDDQNMDLQINNDHVEEVNQVIPQIQEIVNPLALQHNGNHLAFQPQPIQHVQDAGLLDNLEWLNIFNFDGIDVVGGLGQEHVAGHMNNGNVVFENGGLGQENGGWDNVNGLGESDDEQEQQDVEIMADPELDEALGLWDDVNGEENWNIFNMNEDHNMDAIPHIQVNGNQLGLQQVQHNGHLAIQPNQHVQYAGLWNNFQNMDWQNIANFVGNDDQGPVGGLEGWDYVNGLEVILQPLPNQALGPYGGVVNGGQNLYPNNMNDYQNLELQLNNDPPPDGFFDGVEEYIEGLVNGAENGPED